MFKAISYFLVLLPLVGSISPLKADTIQPFEPLPLEGQEAQLGSLGLNLQGEWTLSQKARTRSASLLGLTHKVNGAYVLFFVKPQHQMAQSFLDEISQPLQADSVIGAGMNWQLRSAAMKSKIGTLSYLTAFEASQGGETYYGYAMSSSVERSVSVARSLLEKTSLNPPQNRSLTGDDFQGKKYYLGWGAVYSSDPNQMHNEVKYDVLHTHDIFTDHVGGNYLGDKLLSSVNGSYLRSKWQELRKKIGSQDMYIQYSSGHGSQSGLGVGVSYDEIRDHVLSLPAKEMVVFTMACYSGNLIDSFNRKKSMWSDFHNKGRTLFVMSSSPSYQTSSTGPGTDSQESGGPMGSAGSAFGHALWKSLIGHADGYVSGIKDGFLTLEEVLTYTKYKTNQVGGHMPQVTGSYHPLLVFTQVPSKARREELEKNSSAALTEQQIMDRIEQLNDELKVSR